MHKSQNLEFVAVTSRIFVAEKVITRQFERELDTRCNEDNGISIF